MNNEESTPVATLEITSTVDQANRMLSELFPLNFDLEAYKNKIINAERIVASERANNNSWMGPLERANDRKNEDQGIGDYLFLATGSQIKLHLVEDIARKYDYHIIPVDHEQTGQTEEAIHQELRGKGEIDQRYTTTLALRKLKSITGHFKDPVLAMDTVVKVGPDILEKPKDPQEARAMIHAISGQEIQIITGVDLVQYVKNGMRLITYQPVELRMRIKELTDEEIGNFTNDNLETMLQIAGGVDYATDQGRSLIDDDKPIEVSAPDLGNGTYNRFDKNKKVLVAKSAVKALDTYFKGAPSHLINALTAQIRPVYEAISFTHL